MNQNSANSSDKIRFEYENKIIELNRRIAQLTFDIEYAEKEKKKYIAENDSHNMNSKSLLERIEMLEKENVSIIKNNKEKVDSLEMQLMKAQSKIDVAKA